MNLFLKEINADISNLGRFLFLESEYDIESNSRLDILIQYERHAFIIENKIWGSDDKKQLDKYISWIEQQNCQYSIIFLTMAGNEPKFSEKWKLEDKKFILLSYNIYEWLSQCSVHCKSPKVVSFIEEFKEWIEFTIRGGESIMSESDVLQQLIINDKDKFAMLWNITYIFDFKKYLTEDCVQNSREALMRQLENKLSSEYSITMDNPIFQEKKQGWISLYKEDWIVDDKPIIFYAIETLTWNGGIQIGISRKDSNFNYPNEDNIIRQFQEMANENGYKICCKKTSWWLGQVCPRIISDCDSEEDKSLYMAWHLTNDDCRKRLLDEVIEITEQMIRKTESIMNASIQQLKNT